MLAPWTAQANIRARPDPSAGAVLNAQQQAESSSDAAAVAQSTTATANTRPFTFPSINLSVNRSRKHALNSPKKTAASAMPRQIL